MVKGNPNYERCGDKPILIKTEDVIEVERWNEDHLELDKNGYFLFEVEEEWIYVGLVEYGNVMTKIFRGRRAIDLFKFMEVSEEICYDKFDSRGRNITKYGHQRVISMNELERTKI